MSRICVKNFPKYVTEKQLGEKFSLKGEITDMKLFKRSLIAFIGYRSEKEAEDAIKFFNNTYIGTCKILVEVAREKVYEKSSGEIAKRDKKIMKKPEADDDHHHLQELLKPKFWSDNVSDMEYLKTRDDETDRVDDDDDDDDDDDAMEVDADGNMAQKLKADSDDDDVLHTGRLFALNLPYSTTEEEIMEHFKKFGEISEVHIVLDKETKRSKGIAYILYQIPESAARAMETLDNKVFQGRFLGVLPAKHRETSDKQVNDTRNLPKTFKQKKEEQRKASEARGNTKAWNSFYIRPSTIPENIARMFGVKKSEILDRESKDPAVRFALGETKVIMETKKALAEAGVNVTSLENFAKGEGDEKNRSKHILLVKNLPFAATVKQLTQMFGKFGSIDKIILPRTKALALVVFLEPAEALEAMKRMAYKSYIGEPLYLEWAPGDILEPKAILDDKEKKSDFGEIYDVRRVNLEHTFEIDSDITESNVLHVKNLSFKTSDESLKKHLSELVMKQGKILSVKIVTREKNGRNLSSGYGFVAFDSIETATSVYRDGQGTVVDGHALIFRFSENKKRSDRLGKGSDKDKNLKKLHVKNVPFEATVKELRRLISPFAKIKSLRIPKKNTGKHAGYAFIEFMTNQEALNAQRKLSNTPIYRRKLVFEWAKDDDSMEANRARSAAKYMAAQGNIHPKKRKSSTLVAERRIKFQRNC